VQPISPRMARSSSRTSSFDDVETIRYVFEIAACVSFGASEPRRAPAKGISTSSKLATRFCPSRYQTWVCSRGIGRQTFRLVKIRSVLEDGGKYLFLAAAGVVRTKAERHSARNSIDR
jgi:hypothetical protein